MSEITLNSSQQNHRKRSRNKIANPANTLDGLVAKRADDIGASDSLHKRYLTEAEAIEAPTDDQEMKRIETDPDVSTRTCSVCGYQGKWVSEMIRHKRVHTNERPFRCKYCSRTSKWKADLIRHVAKTHGIRVVSKYSRSKTFHNNSSPLNLINNISEGNENRNSCIQISTYQKINEGTLLESKKFRSLRSPIMYRCTVCMFQQDSVLLLISHLKNVHNVLPYECHSCGISFLDVHTTTKHFSEASTCTRNDLKINIAPLYATKTNSNCKSSFTLLDEAAKRTAQELFYKSHLNTNITSSSTSNSVPTIMPNEKCDIEQMSNAHISKRYCEENQKILDHTLQEMNYKCTICNWSAKKICAMGEHLRLHAVNPSQSLDDSLSKFFETKIKTQPDGSTTESELSLQTLASMSIPLPIWITPNQSAFKQIHPIPGKIQPNISYTPIPAFREIQQEAIQKLCSLFIDTSIKNSQNAINTIPNFSPSLNSESLCSINSPSSHESVNSSSKSTISDVSTSSSNSLISDVIIKPSEHQYEQRSTLCPAIIVTKSKIQQPNNDDEEPEKKNSLTIIHNQMEEDDFVDVVQIDD